MDDAVVVDPAFVGKTIAGVNIEDDQLKLSFADGTFLTFRDDARCCCEERHMSSDDDLPYYVGSQFRGVELRDGPGVSSDYDCHDTQFLGVLTSLGAFTVVNHNEHNGYYGGFNVVATAA